MIWSPTGFHFIHQIYYLFTPGMVSELFTRKPTLVWATKPGIKGHWRKILIILFPLTTDCGLSCSKPDSLLYSFQTSWGTLCRLKMVGCITLHPLLGAAVNLYLVLLMWLDHVLSYVGLHKITYLYCKMRSTKTRLQ